MKIPSSLPNIERRFTTGAVELRTGQGDKRIVRGYAAMFGKRSSNLGYGTFEFYEIIERGAFDDVLKDDVRCLFNHDANLILARSKNGDGTLKFGSDDTGLWYECEPDVEQTYSRDLLVALKRGDVDQSSFAFSLTQEGQKWEETREGEKTVVLRTIKKVSRLYDVSPVTYPAYPDATVALRSLEEFRATITPPTPPVSTFPLRSLWAARLGLRN
jgi:HK97 family phage prohead protease